MKLLAAFVLAVAAGLIGTVVVATANPVPLPDYEALAREFICDRCDAEYVTRGEALRMDDDPKLRTALRELSYNSGFMTEEESKLFDKGFGQACAALAKAREAYKYQQQQPGGD